MGVRGYRSFPALLVIIGSFALLGLLAGLEYHWLSQLSSDERVRMASVLETGVARFCEDFDRELARAWVAFRMNGETLRQRNWENFAERYEHWIKESPDPELVAALYLVSGGEQMQVERFDPSARTFVASAVPAELQMLRERMKKRQASLSLPDPPSLLPFVPAVFPDAPLLLIPVVRFPKISSRRPPPTGAHHSSLRLVNFVRAKDKPFSYIAVQLNNEYIRGKLLPELVKRYFGEGSDGHPSEYQVSIINQTAPEQVIYSTASTPLTAAGLDASGTLLTLRPKLVENFSFETAAAAGGEVMAETFPAGPPRSTIMAGAIAPDLVFKGGRAGLNVRGMPEPVIRTAGSKSSGVFFTQFASGLPGSVETGSWQLRVTHRAGSLNDAAEKLRRQNLLISFSILLLLGASGVLIYVSAHRARRLAHQQIEFVAGVSHELRIPVSVVCLTSANLADGLIREPEQIEKYGQLIHSAGRRLAQAIAQVLDFAGSEMIRKPYQFAEVEIEDLITSALAACRAECADFAIETAIAESLPKLWGDRAALESALKNLISNAVKYSGESRQIEVGARLVPAHSFWPRQTVVQISVEDHGIGIERGELTSIFEPFKRGAAAAAAQIPGNGLGLYLVRRIITAHGGKVTVESVPGQGSIFTLHLPANR